MKKQMSPRSILFSPIGDTDPIRNCYDGACLHIVRHYKPDMVILFYTEDMKLKQRQDQRYTRALQNLHMDIQIEEIFTDITEPHLYDSFIHILPAKIYELHDKFPDAEILLNLSSGTPQMKTVMAIISVDAPWCKGIQVPTPVNSSNRDNPATKDHEDVNALLQNNLDDEKDAVNRCVEPPLRVLRYYADKHRILALIARYDYQAAFQLAKANKDMPPMAVKLLEHAAYRFRLMPKKAREVLSQYKSILLAPFRGAKERLLEYFLVMQIECHRKELHHILLESTPFLYELLQEYTRINLQMDVKKLCDCRKNDTYHLSRKNLELCEPNLLSYLDSIYLNKMHQKYKDSDLSFLLLKHISQYAAQAGYTKDMQIYQNFMAELGKLENIPGLRNNTAHTIRLDLDETEFHTRIKISSMDFIHTLYHLLCLLYGAKELNSQRGIYDSINRWVKDELES